MPPQKHHVVCLDNREIAKDVFEVRFEKPEGLMFRPGQFVLFDVPLLNNKEDIQPRAYSIASTSSEKDLLFILKLKPEGRASAWVSQILKPGDYVHMQRPLGLFGQLEVGMDKVAMLTTSSGIAPFRSMLMAAAEEGDMRSFELLFGVRTEQDLFWLDTLASLQAQLPNLKVHLALTQPGAEWKGFSGRIQTVVKDAIPDLEQRHIFVCGNPNMTAEIKKLCLEDFAIPKSQLHVEGYI